MEQVMVRIVKTGPIFFTFFLVSHTILSQNYCASRGYDTTNIFTNSDLDSVSVLYGENKNWLGKKEHLNLTLVYPSLKKDSALKRPFIMYIHGGGFLNGDDSDAFPYLHYMAEKGYVCASMDYRLGWDTGGHSAADCKGDSTSFNEAIYRAAQDARGAMRVIVSKASKYHIDTANLFVAGVSAGAFTALNTVYTTQQDFDKLGSYLRDSLGPLDSADNKLTSKYALKGVISESGCIHDINDITLKNVIPMLLFQGTADSIVPYDFGHIYYCPNYITAYGSLSVEQRALLLNSSFELNEQPDSGHSHYYPIYYIFQREALYLKRVLCNKCFQEIRQDTTEIWHSDLCDPPKISGIQSYGKETDNCKLFPNPNNGNAELEIAGYTSGTVEIYNTTGQKVYSSPYTPTEGGQAMRIDLCNRPDGLYLYRVVSENGELIGEGKMIIEK